LPLKIFSEEAYMPNFFVDKESFEKDPIIITGEEANHALKVLRLTVGEEITIFDGEGQCAEAIIESTAQKEVTASVKRRFYSESEPKLKITLFQGIPKGTKLDMIIQKAVEIGVCKIVPVAAKRSVAKIEKDSKMERYRRIAFEAAKQCGRALVPKVENPMSFEEAVRASDDCDVKIIPYECEKDSKIDLSMMEGAKTLAVFIGPEGGFEESEVKIAEEHGAKRVTLGKRILRTETAGLVSAAICLYAAGDME
jgi:16S rRNA (uracil1498-N3)-methyltransferase